MKDNKCTDYDEGQQVYRLQRRTTSVQTMMKDNKCTDYDEGLLT